MRIFTITCLKCSKCQSTKLQKLEIGSMIEYAKTKSAELENSLLNRLREGGVSSDEISALFSGIPNFTEGNAVEFVEGGVNETVAKLMFDVDVREGSVFCVECGDEKKIQDGILKLI